MLKYKLRPFCNAFLAKCMSESIKPIQINSKWLAVLASLLCLLGYSAEVAAETPRRPNVILIMADDLGYGDTGFTGHQTIQTPNLDAMANNGLTFDRFYAQAPSCSPTRASFLTGRNGIRTGIDQFLSTSQPDNKINNQDVTIAELAQTQGYTTGHFGKWHVGSVTKTANDMRLGAPGNHKDYSPPWTNGYDVAFTSENWMPTYDPYDQFASNRNGNNVNPDAAYWTGFDQRVPGSVVNDRYTSDVIAEQTNNFITQASQGSEPFLTTVWFTAPHTPIFTDPGGTGYDNVAGLSNSERGYYEVVTQMDNAIGEIRAKVQELGLAEDTLIVFTSDNGPANGPGQTDGFRDRKESLYEGGIRVPAVFEWEGQIDAGTSTDVAATTSDFLPTLNDLWGIKLPDDRALDGESIKPVLQGDAFQRSDTLKFRFERRGDQAIMNDQYKLISTNNGNSYELYDLINDPTETMNIAGNSNMQTVVNSLRAELETWLGEVDISRAGGDYRTGIASVTGATIDESSPGSFDRGDLESAEPIVVIEKQLATLRTDLSVDSDGSAGIFDADNLPSGATLLAGTVVDSFLIHFDNETTGNVNVESTIEFENEILGVIASLDKLNASDFLAFGDPFFDETDAGRQTLFGGEGSDFWTIGEDGRTLHLDLVVGGTGLDQLRVLTRANVQAIPEPSSLILLGLGTVGLLTRRRR